MSRTLALAMLVLPCIAHAEDLPGAVEGAVTDRSGAPVAGVTIYAHDADGAAAVSTVTNEHGLYLIKGEAGRIELVAVFGQTAVTRSVELVAGRTNHLDLQVDTQAGEVITIREHLGGAVPVEARPVENYGRLKLPYSDQAIDEDIWAVGWLLLDIDTQGRVTGIRFAHHPGHDLDKIAVKQAFGYRFRPARDESGRPVASTVLWRMEWRPYWREQVVLTVQGAPNCRDAGPMNMGEFFPTYQDCSGPDFEAAEREPVIKNPALR